MKKTNNHKYDFIIIGGGFFGISLALFLSTVTKNILLIEKENSFMKRASKNNQARVHSGFHYPRSALTAVKSLMLKNKFANDFPESIIDDFQMIYAITKHNSKVSSKRFYRMFSDMKAPISKSNRSDLFNMDLIDEIFECTEYAFDYKNLKDNLNARIESSGIEVKFETEVKRIIDDENIAHVIVENDICFNCNHIFNITYGNINNLLSRSKIKKLDIKNELVELAIIQPPSDLNNLGITVMDGPFFSTMPFPSGNSYTLTHVRHSLHKTWLPTDDKYNAYDDLSEHYKKSKFNFMIKDSQRFLPSMKNAKYIESLYEIKSVLLRNEINDGRPILYHRKSSNSRITSVLGGKIDNIYDLFDMVRSSFPNLRDANTSFLTGT